MGVVHERAVLLKKELEEALNKEITPDKHGNYYFKPRHRIVLKPITWIAQFVPGSRAIKIGGRHYTHPESFNEALSFIKGEVE